MGSREEMLDKKAEGCKKLLGFLGPVTLFSLGFGFYTIVILSQQLLRFESILKVVGVMGVIGGVCGLVACACFVQGLRRRTTIFGFKMYNDID